MPFGVSNGSHGHDQGGTGGHQGRGVLWAGRHVPWMLREGWTPGSLPLSSAPCQLQGPPKDVFLPLPNGLTYRVPVINLPLMKDAKLTSGS